MFEWSYTHWIVSPLIGYSNSLLILLKLTLATFSGEAVYYFIEYTL